MTEKRPFFPDRFFLYIFGRYALIGMTIIAVIFISIPWEWLLNFNFFREFKILMYLISPNVVSVYHAGFVNPDHVASMICVLNSLGFLLTIVIAIFSRTYLKKIIPNDKVVKNFPLKAKLMFGCTLAIPILMIGVLYNDGSELLKNLHSTFAFAFEELSIWWVMCWCVFSISLCTIKRREARSKG